MKDKLIGLTMLFCSKCPFCGEKLCAEYPNKAEFACGSSYYLSHKASIDRDWCCEAKESPQENATLRARVKELQSKVQRLTEAGDFLELCLTGEEPFRSSAKSKWNKAKEGV